MVAETDLNKFIATASVSIRWFRGQRSPFPDGSVHHARRSDPAARVESRTWQGLLSDEKTDE